MADSPLMTAENPVIVFDFDGVVTTLDINWTALRHNVSKKLGLEIETFASFFEESFGTERFEEASKLVREREMDAAREAVPFPDVEVALRLLGKRKGAVKSHVASMQSTNVLDYFLGRHNLRSGFGVVLGREDGGSKRVQLEKIRAMEEAQRRSGGTDERKFILIDDVSRNIEVARHLGYEGILYRRKNSTKSLAELVSESIRE